MPDEKYLDIKIGGRSVEVTEISELPLAISYKLEDPEDFQKKRSAEAFNVKIPATLQNDLIANSYTNPASEDNTPGQIHKSHQPAVITAGGTDLLNGKAFLIKGTHDRNPLSYEYSFYGNNADWIIDLKEKTLFDFARHILFDFTVPNIINSWSFDGTNESLPYVFAPVRYRGTMDVENNHDGNMSAVYMRPSISVYWLIYWGFKSLGYKIQSTFMDTPYFRGMTMPWTWGNFLDSDGTELAVHKFLAKSEDVDGYLFEDVNEYLNLVVSNDNHDGGYDNNNDYSWNAGARSMTWEYKTPDFGTLDATFSIQVFFDAYISGGNSYIRYNAHWFHYVAATGITTQFSNQTILNENGRNDNQQNYSGIPIFYETRTVNQGDRIIVKLKLDSHTGKTSTATAFITTAVLGFQLEYFRIPIGGEINFQNYVGFKKHKFLDFLGGVMDCFDMSANTDTLNKVVTLEPSHDYSLTNDLSVKSGGYFNGRVIDWSDKKDFSEPWDMDLFSDYNREVNFKFKPDENDGLLKTLTDRHQTTIGAAKYVLPSRFKAGKKDFENRFFSACVHYDNEQMKTITGVAPQFVTLVPENISQTSNTESANTFQPKICFYKGNVYGVGGWKFNGQIYTSVPFMFAVNYKNGVNDPVLSYSDENIGGVIAHGLMKRYFWQRFAIMRNGQVYHPFLRLNNNDVANVGHREFKVIDGQKYELVEIEAYKPLKDESTPVTLRRWVPITNEDFLNSFPSSESVLTPTSFILGNDVRYWKRMALTTDIPTT